MRKFKFLTLMLALLMVVTGCTTADTSYVATYNGENVSSGVYLNLQLQAYEAAWNLAPESTDIFSETLEGQDAEQWIIDNSVELLKEYVYIESEFERLGLVLDEAETGETVANLNDLWTTQGQIYESRGISLESAMSVALSSFKREAVFYALYGEGGEKEIPTEELETYYQENYVRVRHMIIPKFTTNAETGESVAATGAELEAIIDIADDYETRAKDGENFIDLILDNQLRTGEATATGELVLETDPEAHDFIMHKDDTNLPAEYLTAAFEAAEGDIFRVETEDFIIVSQKHDIMEPAEDLEDYLPLVSLLMKGEEYTAYVSEQAAALDITMNQAAIDRYSPKDIEN